MKKLISFIFILFVSLTTFGQCIEGPDNVCVLKTYTYRDSCAVSPYNWHSDNGSAQINIIPYDSTSCFVIGTYQDFKLYCNNDWKQIHIMEKPANPKIISGCCGSGVHDTVHKNDICHYFLTSDTSNNNHIWEVKGGIINGDIHGNNIYVTWTDIGDHNTLKVSDTNSNGCSSSNIRMIHIIPSISIDNIRTKSSLKIYPNPATDVININFDNKIDYIEIYNVSGQKVFETQNNKNSINVSEYPTGIYVIKIKNDKTLYFEKFLKK